ncbi:MAG TPA: cytochrome c [Terracidiphilus sp.]|nr:cytochrome c [Terracidiphilus sp.]
MKFVGPLILCCIVLAGTATFAQMKDTAQQSQQPAHPPDTPPVNPDRGQQVFNQNCSRCHNTPEGFSPRISGSIAKHMRVRAGLGDADYKALLRFLNP